MAQTNNTGNPSASQDETSDEARKQGQRNTEASPRASAVPVGRVICPGCGLDIWSGYEKCWKCGTPLRGKPEEIEEPEEAGEKPEGMDAIVIYWSKTGNTEKVALAIQEGLEEAGANVSLKRVEDAGDIDFYAYDLVCIGFPSYQWSPPRPVDQFLKDRFKAYRDQGRVKVGAPKVPGKNALIFCTYSGPHTGIREAIPAGLYAGQFFEHLGFTVLDEWYVVGEYHGLEEASTQGRLGDIRGRPNEEDLRKVRQDARQLVGEIEEQESVGSTEL